MTDPWINAAQQLPIAFAQVREDPSIDARVADRLAAGGRVFMIASGGCTLAWLARHQRIAHITAVDPNPAQLALAQLKQALARHAEPAEQLALLGHAPMRTVDRRAGLEHWLSRAGLPADSLGPLDVIATHGPDYAGRYERLFAQLQARISADSTAARAINALLRLGSPDEQRSWWRAHHEVRAMLAAHFADTFARPALVELFGEAATRNPARSFADHFFAQLEWTLDRHAACSNPFLWQVLLGQYPAVERAAWLIGKAAAPTAEVTDVHSGGRA